MNLWLKHTTKLLLPCYLPLLQTLLDQSFSGDISSITCLMPYGAESETDPNPSFAPQVVHGWVLILAALWRGRIQEITGHPWLLQSWNSLAG